MIIKTYPIGVYEENIYVLVDETSRDGFIVDPGGNGEVLIKEIEKLNCNIKFVLLTHGHFDHVEALSLIVDKFNVPVYMNEIEEEYMKKDNSVFGNLPKSYVKVTDGDEIDFSNYIIKCIHTPGHTKGGMCYLYRDVMFTGDTLFKGSIGRSDFIGGDFNELVNSIKSKLMILDESIKVYPGHMDSSTIGFEKRTNPFLQEEFDIF